MFRSRLIFKFLLAFALITCSCNSLKPGLSIPDQWYRTYTGKMENQEIVLHLTKGDDYKGYLWLKDSQKPVMVYSDPTLQPKEDSIYLNGGNANYWIRLKGISKEDIRGEFSVEINRIQEPAVKVRLTENTTFSPFNFIFSKEKGKLPDELDNQSFYEYFMGTIVPTENTPAAARITSHIRKLLDIPETETDISGWMDSLQKSSLDKWTTEGKNLTGENAAIMGMSFSEQLVNHLGVMYENAETISLANYRYIFEGGAHGNYHTTLVNIDKRTGDKINLEDVLSPAGIKELPKLLDQSARSQYEIKNHKSLKENGFFVDTLKPGKNFYLTSKGLGFYYSPYEIKPFAAGEINLFVPKDALKDYWIR